jgi:hypothetical protein
LKDEFFTLSESKQSFIPNLLSCKTALVEIPKVGRSKGLLGLVMPINKVAQ